MTQNLPALLAATARVQKLRVLASLRGRFDHAYWSVSPKDVHFASQAWASTLNPSTPVNLSFGFGRGPCLFFLVLSVWGRDFMVQGCREGRLLWLGPDFQNSKSQKPQKAIA